MHEVKEVAEKRIRRYPTRYVDEFYLTDNLNTDFFDEKVMIKKPSL